MIACTSNDNVRNRLHSMDGVTCLLLKIALHFKIPMTLLKCYGTPPTILLRL